MTVNDTTALSQSQRRVGFLTDQSGKPSAMRLMSFVALTASVWFGWLTINDSQPTTDAGMYLTTTFLVAAFAPKTLQKFIEQTYSWKNPGNNP